MIAARWRPAAVPAALAVAAIAATLLLARLQQPSAPYGPVGATVTALAAAAWGWRHRRPVESMVAVALLTTGYLVAGYAFGPIQVFVVLSSFALARRRPFAEVALVCAAAAALLGGALALRLHGAHPGVPAAVVLAFLVSWPGVFVVVPMLGGALVRSRSAAAARGREELIARGAAQERLRVAREVHDVAGHGFAVVAMQAGVALTVLEEDPEQARASLAAIRATSEQALQDLHLTLRDLTAPEAAPDADHAPAAPAGAGTGSRTALTALVERTRAAGLPVDLTIEGPDVAPSPRAAQAVYRVVQEALTNVIKHAGAARASVRVRYGPDEVAVEVLDAGRGTAASEPRETGGRGLAGIRARVDELGGSLVAADRPGGGFGVTARIPARDVAASGR